MVRPYQINSLVPVLGLVSQKAGLLTDPVKDSNSVTLIIIIDNNTCGVNHIYRPGMYVGDTPPSIEGGGRFFNLFFLFCREDFIFLFLIPLILPSFDQK